MRWSDEIRKEAIVNRVVNGITKASGRKQQEKNKFRFYNKQI